MRSIEIVDSLRSLYPLQDFEEKAVMEVVEELKAYRAIGTIERFRELTEKAEPKKPYIQQAEIDFYEHDCMECPSCDSFLGYASDCKDEHYQDNYCPHCGQRLNWE